jgi:hypothetical protein
MALSGGRARYARYMFPPTLPAAARPKTANRPTLVPVTVEKTDP